MSPPAVTAASLGAWLLKVNPASTSVDELRANRFAGVRTRCLRHSYRADLIQARQPVLLWISGGDRRHPSGLYAQGRTKGRAALDDQGQLVMPLTLEPVSAPVLRDELRGHPVLALIEVLRMPAGSNPSFLSVTELAELRHGWPQVTVGGS